MFTIYEILAIFKFFATLYIRKVRNKRWSVMNSISMNSVSFKGVQENIEPEKKISAAEIEQKADEFTRTVDTVADSVNKTTDSVVGASTKVIGSVGTVGMAFSKLIPNAVKDFFAPAKKVLDEQGKAILDKNGETVMKRVANLKHIGIAAGVAAVVAAGVAIYKGVKGHIKHKRELELLNVQNEAKAESAKPKEEIAEPKTEEIPNTEE